MPKLGGYVSNMGRGELIDETIKLVEGEKKSDGLGWYQSSYYDDSVGCGTALCVAGSAAHHAGYMPCTSSFGLVEFNWKRPRGSNFHYIDKLAGALLGLNEREGDYLFEGDRTKAQVLDALHKLKAGGKVSDLPSYKKWHGINYDLSLIHI